MFYCCSAISKAIINNDIENVKRLIAKGSNLNIQDNMGWTPLHIAVKKQCADIVHLLLQQPEAPVNKQDVEGNTPLILACETKQPDVVIVENVLQHDADINIPNNMDITALHIAAKKNHELLIKFLLRYKPNLNCQDFNKYTPLHYAIENKCERAVELLLTAGADANVCELNGLNALMFSCLYDIRLALSLICYTSDLNAKASDGWTALMFAVNKCEVELVRELIGRGAEIHVEAEGHTVLTLAIQTRNFEIFKMIWSSVSADTVSQDSRVMQKVFQYWNLHEDIDNFDVLFSREDINIDLRTSATCTGCPNQCSLFTILFSKFFNSINFDTLEDYYFRMVRHMLSRSTDVSNSDIKYFIKYFCNCPYAIELLEMIMQTALPNITEDILFYALQESFSHPIYLLQYCVHLNKNSVFNILLETLPFSFVSLQAFAKMFTISLYWKQKFYVALNTRDNYDKLTCDRFLNITLKVDSLKELSRDAVRRYLKEICKTTRQFLNVVNTLCVPQDVKDIIQCKTCPIH